MWGYIESEGGSGKKWKVPSLYVRVYRTQQTQGLLLLGSLIICEGISERETTWSGSGKFPHYMWGYIAEQFYEDGLYYVPSLYVRVYRVHLYETLTPERSLIICEGISMITCSRSCCLAFPHYMWGYIAPQVILIITGKVPSLYVRVYLLIFLVSQYRQSSLIICEGISLKRILNIIKE